MTDKSTYDVLCLGLYSAKYPAIGESHGLSIIAGAIRAAHPTALRVHVIDMVALGDEDIAPAVTMIRKHKIRCLAVGLYYGTYSVLARNYAQLRAELHGDRPLTIFGGPIATYQSERLLSEIDPYSVVIIGEGDDAAPAVISAWIHSTSFRVIPNLHYIDQNGKSSRTARRLADLRSSAAPYRDHITSIRKAGGQIFAESSRGCSWAACTFCLRGLTDVAGRGVEFRRKPAVGVVDDLTDLRRRGVPEVTIADEDFLGTDLAAAEELVDLMVERSTSIPSFDASLTVHSVFSRRDSAAQSAHRQNLLEKLKTSGLQKAFLGIESCSPTQLKRFAKGHTREEAVSAVYRLQQKGIRVEIGVILFDALSTLDEIEDSLRFMARYDLTVLASGVSSELRLQVGSSYLRLLENYERQTGVTLQDGRVDPDTLSISYSFARRDVAALFLLVNSWNAKLHPLYYPAKSLTRFGSGGALGEAAGPLRSAVEMFRSRNVSAILEAIMALRRGEDADVAMRKELIPASVALADAVRQGLSDAPVEISGHPVILGAAAAADAVSSGRRRRDSFDATLDG